MNQRAVGTDQDPKGHGTTFRVGCEATVKAYIIPGNSFQLLVLEGVHFCTQGDFGCIFVHDGRKVQGIRRVLHATTKQAASIILSTSQYCAPCHAVLLFYLRL